MQRFYLIYFIIIFLALSICITHVFSILSRENEDLQKYETTVETIDIATNKTIIPSKETMMDLKEIYLDITSGSQEIATIKEEISTLYKEVCNAPVCSIANRKFNELSEKYVTYKKLISKIQEDIYLYEEKYKGYLDSISNIPKFFSIYQEKSKEFNELFLDDYESISAMKLEYYEDAKMLGNFYVEANQIADAMFEEYYDLMCRIVYLEAGYCSTKEQYLEANSIENRIKHKEFPNTLYDVLYQPGQYAPVMNGSIDTCVPDERTCKNVEFYLRGHAETGMPDTVVYQALFTQGRVWNPGFKTKNIFCHYKE